MERGGKTKGCTRYSSFRSNSEAGKSRLGQLGLHAEVTHLKKRVRAGDTPRGRRGLGNRGAPPFGGSAVPPFAWVADGLAYL